MRPTGGWRPANPGMWRTAASESQNKQPGAGSLITPPKRSARRGGSRPSSEPNLSSTRPQALARGARLRVSPEDPEETAPAPTPFGLTRREQEVCEVMAQGATNREIAAKLYISERTAAVHVSSILRKLGVQTRLEASLIVQRLSEQQGKRVP